MGFRPPATPVVAVVLTREERVLVMAAVQGALRNLRGSSDAVNGLRSALAKLEKAR